MEILMHPHWETASDPMRRVFSLIEAHPFLDRFYLAGGTALALQLGHRCSVDLDYFSETDELTERTRGEIIYALQRKGFEIIENSIGNLVALYDGVQVGFFSYGYPLVQSSIKISATSLASIADIGLMKCDALISRGSRKDFYDLYYIDRITPFEELFILAETKYAYYRDFALTTIEHMLAFENADRDEQPRMIENIGWNEARNYFTARAVLLGKNLLLDL